MTWSYSGDPANSTNDSIRFLIGDTDTNDRLITNEEIAYIVTQLRNLDIYAPDPSGKRHD